jgi:hypothetical protein
MLQCLFGERRKPTFPRKVESLFEFSVSSVSNDLNVGDPTMSDDFELIDFIDRTDTPSIRSDANKRARVKANRFYSDLYFAQAAFWGNG